MSVSHARKNLQRIIRLRALVPVVPTTASSGRLESMESTDKNNGWKDDGWDVAVGGSTGSRGNRDGVRKFRGGERRWKGKDRSQRMSVVTTNDNIVRGGTSSISVTVDTTSSHATPPQSTNSQDSFVNIANLISQQEQQRVAETRTQEAPDSRSTSKLNAESLSSKFEAMTMRRNEQAEARNAVEALSRELVAFRNADTTSAAGTTTTLSSASIVVTDDNDTSTSDVTNTLAPTTLHEAPIPLSPPAVSIVTSTSHLHSAISQSAEAPTTEPTEPLLPLYDWRTSPNSRLYYIRTLDEANRCLKGFRERVYRKAGISSSGGLSLGWVRKKGGQGGSGSRSGSKSRSRSRSAERIRGYSTEAPEFEPCAIGFDLEWKPTFRPGVAQNPIALVQLASEDEVMLVHVSSMRAIPSALVDILTDKQIVKVGVNIQGDAEKLFTDTALDLSSCLELSHLARIVQPTRWLAHGGAVDSPIGLARLCEAYVGKRMEKDKCAGGMRVSNWEADWLEEGQREYAAADAHAGLAVYKALTKMYAENPTPLLDPLYGTVLEGRQSLTRAFEPVEHWKRIASGVDSMDSPSYPASLPKPEHDPVFLAHMLRVTLECTFNMLYKRALHPVTMMTWAPKAPKEFEETMRMWREEKDRVRREKKEMKRLGKEGKGEGAGESGVGGIGGEGCEMTDVGATEDASGASAYAKVFVEGYLDAVDGASAVSYTPEKSARQHRHLSKRGARNGARNTVPRVILPAWPVQQASRAQTPEEKQAQEVPLGRQASPAQNSSHMQWYRQQQQRIQQQEKFQEQQQPSGDLVERERRPSPALIADRSYATGREEGNHKTHDRYPQSHVRGRGRGGYNAVRTRSEPNATITASSSRRGQGRGRWQAREERSRGRGRGRGQPHEHSRQRQTERQRQDIPTQVPVLSPPSAPASVPLHGPRWVAPNVKLPSTSPAQLPLAVTNLNPGATAPAQGM